MHVIKLNVRCLKRHFLSLAFHQNIEHLMFNSEKPIARKTVEE